MEENFDPTTAKQNDEPSHGRDGNHLDVKDSKAEVLILADRLELKDLFKSGVEYFRSKLENHTAGQMLTVAQFTKMLPSLPKNQRCWRSLSLIRRKSCLLCGSPSIPTTVVEGLNCCCEELLVICDESCTGLVGTGIEK